MQVTTNFPSTTDLPVMDIALPASVQGIPTTAVLEELQKILGSVPFRRSRRLRHFLEFTVKKAVKGQVDGLKEYSIGVEVFGKPDTFDPRLDSIVRVEARRLRAGVERYYATDGGQSEIVILFRPGSYAPTFRKRSSFTPLEQMHAGTSHMLVLVGDSGALESIRRDLSEKVGLVEAKAGLAAAQDYTGLKAVRALGGDASVPVFYVGTPETITEPAA